MEPTLAEQEEPSIKIKRSGFLSKKLTAITLVVLCVLVSWVGVIDNNTGIYVKKATVQALVAYAGARTLNAGISLLQSGEIGGRALVAEVSIHPFEALDPLNDMVEDYASVMKYAIGSLMIQNLLVELFSTSTFKWLITGVAILLLGSLLLFNGMYATPLLKGFLFVTLVRFLFVITILMCGLVDNAFINKKTEIEMRSIDIAATEVTPFEGETAGITTAEKEDMNSQIQALEKRQDEFEERIRVQSEIVASAKMQLDNEKEDVKDARREMGLIKKSINIGTFGFLGKDDDYSEAKREKKDAKAYFKEQEKIQEDLERQLGVVQKDLANQHKQLDGKTGFFESTKDKFTKLKDLSYGRIKNAVTASIDSMLRLIALFVFKTLLMPLTFLLLILRAFKFIWGIDPRSLVSESYAEIKGR